MNINLQCLYCMIKKADARYSKFSPDKEGKIEFMQKVLSLLGTADMSLPSPYLSKQIMSMINESAKNSDLYFTTKEKCNQMMLKAEEPFFNEILKSSDPFLCALKFAMTGNFIDFAAHDEVTEEKFGELINESQNQKVDSKEVLNLRNDLSSGKKLLYLCDNAGEIVFDKMFIKIIKSEFKNLDITVAVRGKPIYNDATRNDAKEIGLDKIVKVIDSETDIPGTYLPKVGKELKVAVESADVIISKGQGNFETLFGCEKNIYYIFLCKCAHFTNFFNVPQFTGMFVNEKRPKL